MLVKLARTWEPRSSEITPEPLFRQRRRFLQLTLLSLGAKALDGDCSQATRPTPDFPDLRPSPYSTSEEPTSYRDVTRYNNFYEFGSAKSDPERYATNLKVRPWTLRVEGAVAQPRVFDIDEIVKLAPLEERIYRLRCVEAWSMVIPWVGLPLSTVLKRVEPTSNAKYVEFITLFDPDQFPAQRTNLLEWPYVEGLRIDEAMHPLTILAVGLYGKLLPNQNGAPIRLVVPWKYGFKSIKSIVTIRLTEQRPVTTWMRAAPREYGFYANVNPDVEHPRWSQAKERRIGEFFRRRTEPFNGYAEQVADLYRGMDLNRHF